MVDVLVAGGVALILAGVAFVANGVLAAKVGFQVGIKLLQIRDLGVCLTVQEVVDGVTLPCLELEGAGVELLVPVFKLG